MKWLMLGTASVLFFMAPRLALSADLGPMPPHAPAPAPPIWTGCYLGANIGGGWAHTTFTNAKTFKELDVNTSGFVGGGQFGCNYQFYQSLVIGVEGDVSGADLSGSTANLHAKANWLASATSRLGYAAGPWLFYVKGGGAWTHYNYGAPSVDVTVVSASDTPTGWTVGGGIEYAFLANWSARFEYAFYDFGSHNLTFAGLVSPTISVKQWMQTFTGGINYHF
jgi:outer membrane immunogenic protein